MMPLWPNVRAVVSRRIHDKDKRATMSRSDEKKHDSVAVAESPAEVEDQAREQTVNRGRQYLIA